MPLCATSPQRGCLDSQWVLVDRVGWVCMFHVAVSHFFQLSMSHVLAWRYQKQVLGWRRLDCVALLLNYVESAQLFLAPAKQVVECQHWWLWERCSGKDSTQVPQVRSMRGKMLSWKILRPGLVFVWNTVSCLKVFLYTPQWCLPCLAHIHSFVIRSTPQRSDA